MEFKAEIAVLLGAIIGGSISVVTNSIQQKSQLNRDLIKIAFEMAVKDCELQIANAKPGGKVAPLESYVTYYIEYLKVMRCKGNRIEELKKLHKFREELSELYFTIK